MKCCISHSTKLSNLALIKCVPLCLICKHAHLILLCRKRKAQCLFFFPWMNDFCLGKRDFSVFFSSPIFFVAACPSYSSPFYTAQWGKDNIMIISGVIRSALKSSTCSSGSWKHSLLPSRILEVIGSVSESGTEIYGPYCNSKGRAQAEKRNPDRALYNLVALTIYTMASEKHSAGFDTLDHDGLEQAREKINMKIKRLQPNALKENKTGKAR